MNGVSLDTRGAVSAACSPCAFRRLMSVACFAFAVAALPMCAVAQTVRDARNVPRELELPAGSGIERLPNAPAPQKLAAPSGSPLVDVRVEGNTTIHPSAIAKHIKTRSGRGPSEAQIREDVRSLYRTRWFLSVEPRYKQTDAGLVLIFKVVERPIVQRVVYQGNNKIKTKHLSVRTGLEVGSPFDVSANREACRVLEEYYAEKGYAFATVQLARGGSRQDREVIFDITEGPKVAVTNIKFTGNEAFSGGLLKTKLRTKTAILWVLGGKYDENTLPDDIAALKQYYHNLGYFDVEIEKKLTQQNVNWIPFAGERAHVKVEYIINEGERYRVRRTDLYGLDVLNETELRQNFEMEEGEYFNARYLAKDVAMIKDKYGELGRLFAKVDAIPRFLEQPGWVDIVYQIDEDKVYRIRRVNVVFQGDNPHTKRSVVFNRMLTRPGELANARNIARSKSRLAGSQLFEGGPTNGPKTLIRRVGEDEEATDFRGQNPGTSSVLPRVMPSREPQPPQRPQSQFTAPQAPTTHQAFSQFAVNPAEYPDVYRVIQSDLPKNETVVRGQSFGRGFQEPQNPLFGNSPAGDPLANGGPGPLPGQYGEEGLLDVDYILTEARTGRLMFGVGVNSDAGVIGSIVLSEKNFDLFNPPRSWQDVIDGTAFRGDGQSFRAEAVPGSQVSRYLVNWTNPYFLDTDYSLGLSGFYYQRFFDDWDERRAGGRISFGRQFTPEWSASAALRLENVRIDSADVFPLFPGGPVVPEELAEVVGGNFLSTIRLSVVHDTRDSAFLPGEGHKVEVAYEQAFGEFDYPRVDVSGSQFFTLYSRPDGGGRHILTLNGQVGWTGSQTPIFERYFAGGFQTFRGFDFRGVGPEEFGVRVGGRFQALGTAEYRFPLLANEMLAGVVFTDFGTVEKSASLDEFRLTVGAGLRVTVPALGPVPLAFDWAFPVLEERNDDNRVFSFYVGLNR